MAKTLVYNAGEFNLKPNQTADYFWDVPDYPGDVFGTWTVTAVPGPAGIDAPAKPEQRVEITNLFLLRKGPGAAGAGANKLQLNYKVRNVGTNPANGAIIISAIVL